MVRRWILKYILQNKLLVSAVCMLIVFVFAVIMVLMLKKVEVTLPSKIKIGEDATSDLIIPNEEVYKFNVNEEITFKINEHFFRARILKIGFDDTKKVFFLNLDHVNQYLIPNTWIDVEIIKDSQSILSSLMSV